MERNAQPGQTVVEYARANGVTVDWVYRLARMGKIAHVRVYGRIFVTEPSHMSMSSMPSEQQTKLKEAAVLMSVVQEQMTTRSDRGSDVYVQTWKDLYWLRQKLDEFIQYGFVLYKGEFGQ